MASGTAPCAAVMDTAATELVAAVTAVVDVVRAHPGMTRAALVRRLTGRAVRRHQVVQQALAAGLLHEGPTFVPTRGGALRSATGLHPGPPTGPAAERMRVEQVRRRRAELRLSQQALAGRLGVHPRLVRHWESGTQPVPTWAAARLAALLDLGRAVLPTRRHARARNELLQLVRRHPGLTRRRLRELQGRRRPVLQALQAALDAGLLHEVPTRRGGVGFWAGSEPRSDGQPPSGAELRTARLLAGRSAGPVARRLGVTMGQLCAWERRDEGLPTWVTTRGREMLADLVQARHKLDERLLQEVQRRPGVSTEQLTRGTFGRAAAVSSALGRLLEQGRVHSAYAPTTDRTGLTRPLRGLHPGPGPAAELMMSGAELEQRRRAVGLSQRALARQLGVSRIAVGHWESGRNPLSPGRAGELFDLLEQFAPTTVPLVDQQRHDDDEMDAAALVVITTTPGLSRRRAAAGMPGTGQRRLAALDRVLDGTRAHLRPARQRYADGRTFTVPSCYPGPAPTA